MTTPMSARTVNHATIVVSRQFTGVSIQDLFAAWANEAQRKEWDLPGNADWVLAEFSQDFRIGGREHSRFGPKADPRYWSEGEFFDIVENSRIVSAGAMHAGDVTSSVTLCTVEFLTAEGGARLMLTDQSAFFGEETPAERESGWGKILDRLSRYLEQHRHA
jgi:uncharacterized protein YndB with AHSA1/START domain